MYATVDSQAPSEQDFADIYKAYYRRVFSLCRYLLNSFDAAEDATHEVFLRAQRKLASYDPAFPFSSWLLGIASHHCIDLLRRRGTERRLFELEGSEGSESTTGEVSRAAGARVLQRSQLRRNCRGARLRPQSCRYADLPRQATTPAEARKGETKWPV